jgi:hypothetical protein
MTMTIFKKNKPNPDRDRFIETARSHLGYKTRPSGLSEFAVRTGYRGENIPWSGAFIDCVARDSEIFLPACVYTPSGLAELIADGRLVQTPEPGDLVFYSFPTTEQFSMPHCGIVTGTGDYAQTGMFLAIEAQINSGLPKASADRNGVFERTRWRHEVIAFVRPDFSRRPAKAANKMQTGNVLIKLQSVRPGRQNPAVQTVQDALVLVCDLRNHNAGEFDAATQQAYARWQRQIGFVYPDCTGVPDLASLRLLGEFSGSFGIKGEN